jgi:uncharacterized protein (DUF1697 family)
MRGPEEHRAIGLCHGRRQLRMPRYVAFLRGVSPLNAKMPDLKRCFEEAGFTDVRTLLASGNVVFTSASSSEAALAQRAEQAMNERLARGFATIVRPVTRLQELIATDPFAGFELAADAKRVVTFLRRPPAAEVSLPLELDGARILKATGGEVFTAYVPSPKGPVFMSLLERNFGTDITTRTIDTVRKCSLA